MSHAVVSTVVSSPRTPDPAPAFVDAVSTLPSRQNQGYDNATMQRLAEKIGDYEIGCLQTDRTSFTHTSDGKSGAGSSPGGATTD